MRVPVKGLQDRREEIFYLHLASEGSKVWSYCFHPLFLNVAVVKPIQAVTVIKNYIITLQVRRQEDKEQENRKKGLVKRK